MLTSITIPMAFLDTQKVDKVLYYVRYGDDSEEINEIVAKCEKDGKCDMYSIKARSEDINKSILPYRKYTFLGAGQKYYEREEKNNGHCKSNH